MHHLMTLTYMSKYYIKLILESHLYLFSTSMLFRDVDVETIFKYQTGRPSYLSSFDLYQPFQLEILSHQFYTIFMSCMGHTRQIKMMILPIISDQDMEKGCH